MLGEGTSVAPRDGLKDSPSLAVRPSMDDVLLAISSGSPTGRLRDVASYVSAAQVRRVVMDIRDAPPLSPNRKR